MRLRDEQGMSITELLAAMSIAVVVFGAAVTAFASFVQQQAQTDRRTIAQDQARTATGRMAAELRNAMSAGGVGAQPVQARSDFDLVFLAVARAPSLVGNPRGLAFVRYCLPADDGGAGRLWRQQAPYSATATTPPSTTSCPSTAWPQRDQVAEHLVNRRTAPATPLFGATLDASGQVTEVSVRPVTDADWGRGRAPVQLRTKVALRNANRPPTAAINCQGLANGHAVCDASASSDPDGQSVTFAWAMNGTTIAGQTTYRLDQPDLASRSVHTFTVTVKDSGGVTAQATQQVTMP